ncbi:hypothetical protein HDU96_010555, partial [Phlyctochytrium bullatum]
LHCNQGNGCGTNEGGTKTTGEYTRSGAPRSTWTMMSAVRGAPAAATGTIGKLYIWPWTYAIAIALTTQR